MKEAKIYLAGSMFDGVIEQEKLIGLQDYLRGYLSENGLTATAPAVYLEESRFDRAGLFLANGFDVIPADSEPFQIALSALYDSSHADPPDEFIFGFAGEVPSRFLEKLSGRSRRVLLTIGGNPVAPCDASLEIGALIPGTGPSPAVPRSATKPTLSPPTGPHRAEPAVVIPIPPREPESLRFPPPGTKTEKASVKPVASPAAKPAQSVAPTVTPVTAQPSGKTAPISYYADAESLSPSKDPDAVQVEVSLRDCFAELSESLEDHGKIPLSELAASVRAQVPGMEKASDSIVQSLLPEDFRCIDDGGHLTIYRSDHPELDAVPAEVGGWLLQNDRLLDAELTDGVKGRYPSSEDYINQHWIDSRLPRGISAFQSPKDPVTIWVDARQLAKPTTLYPDFEVVSKRASLMKDFCRWRARKDKRGTTAANQKKEAEFTQRASKLYVNLHAFPETIQEEDLSLFANCYEALEISTRLLAACLDGKLIPAAELSKVGQYCADTVCLLKTVLLERNIDLYTDGVQRDAYDELGKFTKQNHIFLYNMKFEDRINPADAKDIKDHLAQVEKDLTPKDTSKLRDSTRKKIEYHLKKIKDASQRTDKGESNAENPGEAAEEIHNWNAIVEGITKLVRDCGVSWTSDEIKGYLRPFIGKIPEEVEMSDLFIRIVQHIEVGSDPDALHKPTRPAREPKISDAVRKVRKAYKGTKVVFVGGTPQQHIITRLKNAFQVESVIWEESSHGDSLDQFRSVLNDDAVRLVLVYIPWCSHKHSLEFSKQVKEAGKDFVRIRKGTNPDSIAPAICEQVGLK
ncbi:MAG: hypothetical protein ACOX6D_09235 [Thermoguttaceae bacterium]|jgi:hypothetical protein